MVLFFCLSDCLSFLIKYISEQYTALVFMILSALLIWFLSTEMLVNVGFCCFFCFFCFFFFCLFFFVRKSLNYFQVIHGFTNKVRQSYRGEFNFV